MANAVSGIRRTVALVSAMSVLGLTAPAAVHADPPPPPPNPDVLVTKDFLQKTSTAVQRDAGYGVGVAPIGIRAWVAITDQGR